jgi:hypothetical protein
VGALLFRWVFVNDIGYFIYILDRLGIHKVRPLEDPTVAMILLISYACWRTLGFAILMFLAGLKSIPKDLYEAAEVDGASDWQSFRNVTLPMLATPDDDHPGDADGEQPQQCRGAASRRRRRPGRCDQHPAARTLPSRLRAV